MQLIVILTCCSCPRQHCGFSSLRNRSFPSGCLVSFWGNGDPMFSTCVLFLNDGQIKLSCWGKCKDCRVLGKSPRSGPCASTIPFWEQHSAQWPCPTVEEVSTSEATEGMHGRKIQPAYVGHVYALTFKLYVPSVRSWFFFLAPENETLLQVCSYG